MLTSDNKRLKLFDNGITVDEGLPKWKNIKSKDINSDKLSSDWISTPNEGPKTERISDIDFIELSKLSIPELNIKIKANRLDRHFIDEMDRLQSSAAGQSSNVFVLNDNSINGFLKEANNDSRHPGEKVSIFSSIKNWFRLKRQAKKLANDAMKQLNKDKEDNTYKLDVLEFFKLVKLTSGNSTKTYIDRVNGYLQTLLDAQSMGQTALVEKLLTQLIINKYESVLYAEGFYRVITEQQAVNFVKEVEKGVQLVYISNYSRPIPLEVKDKYIKAVGLDIFDNFVVMHYDPGKKSFRLTQEQIRKKRDPILFGIIRGSNKLYYIADWVDEYCDLTLDQFVDKMHYTTKETSISRTINDLG